MKKKKLIYCLVASILLIIGLLTYYLNQYSKKTYDDFREAKISSIQLFDNEKFVLVGVKNAEKSPTHIYYGQNFVSTIESHTLDAEINKSSPSLGDEEYYKLISYNLNSPDIEKKEFNIYSLLDIQKGYRSNSVLMDQYGDGQDFVYMDLYRYKNGEKIQKTILVNIEKEELVTENLNEKNIKMTEDNPYNQNISFGPGNLFDSFRFQLAKYHLRENNGAIMPEVDNNFDYRNQIDISNTNFAQLYPEVAKNMKDIDRLYFRPQQYNQREWFDNLLHWFAPKGQDVMEVYATDSATGEKTQIKSFDDYLAWRDAHPEEVKKHE